MQSASLISTSNSLLICMFLFLRAASDPQADLRFATRLMQSASLISTSNNLLICMLLFYASRLFIYDGGAIGVLDFRT